EEDAGAARDGALGNVLEPEHGVALHGERGKLVEETGGHRAHVCLGRGLGPGPGSRKLEQSVDDAPHTREAGLRALQGFGRVGRTLLDDAHRHAHRREGAEDVATRPANCSSSAALRSVRFWCACCIRWIWRSARMVTNAANAAIAAQNASSCQAVRLPRRRAASIRCAAFSAASTSYWTRSFAAAPAASA